MTTLPPMPMATPIATPADVLAIVGLATAVAAPEAPAPALQSHPIAPTMQGPSPAYRATAATLAAIPPGFTTSEGKITTGVLGVLQLLTALFLLLVNGGAIHVPDVWVSLVPGIDAAVSGWVTVNYTNQRTQLKQTALAAAAPQVITSA